MKEHSQPDRIRLLPLFEGALQFAAGQARQVIEKYPGYLPMYTVQGLWHREPEHWTGTGEARFDLWDLKGRFEAAAALAVPGAVVQVQDNAWVVRDRGGRVVGQAER